MINIKLIEQFKKNKFIRKITLQKNLFRLSNAIEY